MWAGEHAKGISWQKLLWACSEQGSLEVEEKQTLQSAKGATYSLATAQMPLSKPSPKKGNKQKQT